MDKIIVYIGLKKLSDLQYQTSYGTLPIIDKLPDPAHIFGPKTIIGLWLSDQAKIIGPKRISGRQKFLQCGLTFLHCFNFLRKTTFDNLKVLSNGKEGGCGWNQSVDRETLNISADFKILFQYPGPLNSKKRF